MIRIRPRSLDAPRKEGLADCSNFSLCARRKDHYSTGRDETLNIILSSAVAPIHSPRADVWSAPTKQNVSWLSLPLQPDVGNEEVAQTKATLL